MDAISLTSLYQYSNPRRALIKEFIFYKKVKPMSEIYSEPSQASKKECIKKTVNRI